MKEYQSLLLPYAYNILGSVEDAKDAIQDVVLKYTTNKIRPDNEKNYLIKGVINQSINLKRKQQKLQPDEAWLPEPVATERSDLGLELNEMVSYSMLFLLERLNPKERAVFILKEAFAYTHDEVADVLSITIENSRKLLSRAHKKIQQIQKPSEVKQATVDHFKCIDKFTSAVRSKDLNSLHQLLANDIAFHADGGEKIKVVKKYCEGVSDVAQLLVYVHHKYQFKYNTKACLINHQPAVLYYYKSNLKVCQVFEIDNQTNKIKRISVVLDPVKLKNLKV